MQLNYINNGNLSQKVVVVDFDEICDVCVVGLGTAGSIAALAAAKQNVSVIGIEKNMQPGGTGTVGGVYEYFFGSRGGIYEKVDKECFETFKDGYISTDKHNDKSSIPGFEKEYILNKQLSEAGCRIFYGTVITGVFTKEKTAVGVRILRNGKYIDIKAKVIIDSSGTSVVCRICGCNFMPARPVDDMTAPASKLIGLGKNENSYMDSVGESFSLNDKNSESISKSILDTLCSKSWALRDYYTAEDRVLFSSEMVGVRESRCVQTCETLTFNEYIRGKNIEEAIFWMFAPVDNTNYDIAFETAEYQNWLFCKMAGYGFSIPISKKMMIPKDISGVLVASKSIGVGHDMCMLARMKTNMQKCGEAAGVIAGMSVKNSILPIDVEYKSIKDILATTGCFDTKNDIGLRKLAKDEYGDYYRPFIPQTKKEFCDLLSAKGYGTAMWTAYIAKDSVIDKWLCEFMNSSDKMLKRNSALALGMRGNPACIPVIREILNEIPEMSDEQGRYYLDFAKAIVIAGRLKDMDVADRLMDIVSTWAEKYVVNLRGGTYVYRTCETFRCQFVSLAVVALILISDKASDKKEIMNRLSMYLDLPCDNSEMESMRWLLRRII